MASESSLFNIDAIVAAGVPMAFESGSASLSGAARFEREAVPSATGDDFSRRRRVPTMLRARLQFSNAVSADELAKLDGVQITARDLNSGRRAVMDNCTFASLGELGAGGAVDITFAVLSPIKWL